MEILSKTTTPGQSGHASCENEDIFHIHQSSRTRSLPSVLGAWSDSSAVGALKSPAADWPTFSPFPKALGLEPYYRIV